MFSSGFFSRLGKVLLVSLTESHAIFSDVQIADKTYIQMRSFRSFSSSTVTLQMVRIGIAGYVNFVQIYVIDSSASTMLVLIEMLHSPSPSISSSSLFVRRTRVNMKHSVGRMTNIEAKKL